MPHLFPIDGLRQLQRFGRRSQINLIKLLSLISWYCTIACLEKRDPVLQFLGDLRQFLGRKGIQIHQDRFQTLDLGGMLYSIASQANGFD
jgi:hypothetical protein